MHIKINKSTALGPVKLAASCVAKHPDANRAAVLLTADKDGVRVVGVGPGLSASVTIPGATVIDRGEVAVSGESLMRLIGAMGADGVLAVESGKLVLRSAGVTTRLNMLDAADMQAFPTLDTGGMRLAIAGDALKMATHTAGYAVAPDDNRYGLNYMRIEQHGERIRFVSTDGNRLVYTDADGTIDRMGKNEGLPRSVLTALADLSDGVIKIASDDRRVQVSEPGIMLVASKVTSEFPDYGQVLPKGYKTTMRIDRNALADAIGVMGKSLNMGGPAAAVAITIGDGAVKLKARKIDTGEATAEIDADTTGPELSTAMNPRYVLDALGVIGDEQVKWEFGDVLSPSRIVAADGSVHILMPVRLD